MIKKFIFSLLCSGLFITTTVIWADETLYSEPGDVIAAVKSNTCNIQVVGANPNEAALTAAVCNITLYNSFFELCSHDKYINTPSCMLFGTGGGLTKGPPDDAGSHDSDGGSQFGSSSSQEPSSLQGQEQEQGQEQGQEQEQEQYLPPTPSHVSSSSSSTKNNNKVGTWF